MAPKAGIGGAVRQLAAAAALVALLAPSGASPQEPAGGAGDGRTVATVNGEAITAGEVLDIVRNRSMAGKKGEPGSLSPAAALDQIISYRLLYQEARRLGFQNEPDIRESVDSQREKILVGQFVRWKYRDQLAMTDEEYKAMAEGGVHGGSRYTREQWEGIVVSGRVKEKIEQLEAEEGQGAPKEYLTSAYQEENKTGRPYRELVVARVGGTDVTFGQVVDLLPPKDAQLTPPVRGMDAMKFVRGIDRMAGHLRLVALAKDNIDAIGPEVDRVLRGYESALIIRKLNIREIEPKVTLSEAEERAYYERNLEKYKGKDGTPLPLDQVLTTVRSEVEKAKRKAVTAALVEDLRKKAVISVNQDVLNSLGS